MSDTAPVGQADEAPDTTERPSTKLRRDAQLLGRSNSDCRKWLRKKIDGIVKGFEEQVPRSDALDDWWRIYHCELDDNQTYNGDAQVYVPIIHDAINARVTRHSNQLFPQPGRAVDVTSTDGMLPWEIVALLDHYIRDGKLKTEVVKPLLRMGDIEGQYNLYLGWQTTERQIVSRETRAPRDPETGQDMPAGDEAEILDITEEDVEYGRPSFEVLHDADVLVLPASADSIEDAFAAGGSATIVRRWSASKYEDMTDDGEIEGSLTTPGEEVPRMATENMAGLNNLEKSLAKAVGIRAPGPHVIMFETWLMVPLGDKGGFAKKGKKRLCRLWWNLNRDAEGLKRNPYWNDRCPLLSAPVEKIAGVFKGKSLVEALAPVQYEANDAANERADVDHYSAMPMVRRTPGQGNKPIVLNLGAIIDAGPGDLEFMVFPDLSARAKARIMDAMGIIFQSLSVNPSMLPMQQGVAGRRNQAQIAQEQQIDLLTVDEAVTVPEENILTPLLAWMADLDYQFRDEEMTTRAFGELGLKAEMIDVPPLRNRAQYSFRWYGTEQTKANVAMIQQGTAFLNVLNGMKPQIEAEGFRVTIAPLLERSALNIFGGAGAQVLHDARHELSMDPKLENELMLDGHVVPVHPLDQDQEHMQAHAQAMQQSMDPHGTIRVHMAAHLAQMQAKQQAMMMAQAQQMMQQMQGGGQPGKPPGQPGAGPGAPQPGAQPQGPRLIKGPAGMIPPDSMPRAGATMMPRKF